MKDLWHSILREWLPTKLSRLIAATTSSLAIAGIFLPETLKSIGIQMPEEKILLFRVSVPLALLCAGMFVVLILVVRHSRSLIVTPSKIEKFDDLFIKVLILVATYHSQEIPATPKRIAEDIGLDPEITLAHMWKYHNDQFITFCSAGAKPNINTSFILSPKAWQCIKIIKA